MIFEFDKTMELRVTMAGGGAQSNPGMELGLGPRSGSTAPSTAVPVLCHRQVVSPFAPDVEGLQATKQDAPPPSQCLVLPENGVFLKTPGCEVQIWRCPPDVHFG